MAIPNVWKLSAMLGKYLGQYIHAIDLDKSQGFGAWVTT